MNASVPSHHLGDRDPFALAADPANKFVTNERLFGARDVEYPQKVVPDFVDEFRMLDSRKTTFWTRSFDVQSEVESLGDCQSCDVVVVCKGRR